MKHKFKVGQTLVRKKLTPLPRENGYDFHKEIPLNKKVVVDSVGRGYIHLQGFKNWHNSSDFIVASNGLTATLRKTRNNGFRFNLVGKNGEIIATSEVYTTKAKAKQTLKLFPDFELIDRTK